MPDPKKKKNNAEDYALKRLTDNINQAAAQPPVDPNAPRMSEAPRDNVVHYLREQNTLDKINTAAAKGSDNLNKGLANAGTFINYFADPVSSIANRAVEQELIAPKTGEMLQDANAVLGIATGLKSVIKPRAATKAPRRQVKVPEPVEQQQVTRRGGNQAVPERAFQNRVQQNIKKGMDKASAEKEAASTIPRLSSPKPEPTIQGKPASEYLRQNTAKEEATREFSKNAEAGKQMREKASPPREKPVNPSAKPMLKSSPSKLPDKPQVIKSTSKSAKAPETDRAKMTAEELQADNRKAFDTYYADRARKGPASGDPKSRRKNQGFNMAAKEAGIMPKDATVQHTIKARTKSRATDESRVDDINKKLAEASSSSSSPGRADEPTYTKAELEAMRAKAQPRKPEPVEQQKVARREGNLASPERTPSPQKKPGGFLKGIQDKITSSLERGVLKPSSPARSNRSSSRTPHSSKLAADASNREHNYLVDTAKSVMETGNPPSPFRNSSNDRAGKYDPQKLRSSKVSREDRMHEQKGAQLRQKETQAREAKKAKEDALLRQAGVDRSRERVSTSNAIGKSFEKDTSRKGDKLRIQTDVNARNKQAQEQYRQKQEQARARAAENKKIDDHNFEQHAKRGAEMRMKAQGGNRVDKRFERGASPVKRKGSSHEGDKPFVGPTQKPSKPRFKAGDSSRPNQGRKK